MASLKAIFLILGIWTLNSALADQITSCDCESLGWWSTEKSCTFRCDSNAIVAQSEVKSAYEQWILYILNDEFEKAENMEKPWSEAKYFGENMDIKCGNRTKRYKKSNIIAINFENCSMPRILFDMFERYPLGILNISHTNLEQFEPEMFERAANLHTLIASHNHIRSIPYILFWRAEHLEYVDFSHNEIERVPLPALDGARSVVDLNLAKNQITEIDPLLFDSCKNLVSLNLSRNKIREIRAGTFAGAYKLKGLDLSFNSISTISSYAFENLTALEVLHLSANDLQTLPVDIFVGLPALKHLDLAFTRLITIELGTFSFNQKLKSLDLSCNLLKHFDFGLFMPERTELTELLLDANALTELDGFSQNVLPNLKTLGITNNLFKCGYLEYFFEELYWSAVTIRVEMTQIETNTSNINGIACEPGHDDEINGSEMRDNGFEHSELATAENDIESLYYRSKDGDELLIKSIHHRELFVSKFTTGIIETTTEFFYTIFDDAVEEGNKAHLAIWLLITFALIAFIYYRRRRSVAKLDIPELEGKCELKTNTLDEKPYTIPI